MLCFTGPHFEKESARKQKHIVLTQIRSATKKTVHKQDKPANDMHDTTYYPPAGGDYVFTW